MRLPYVHLQCVQISYKLIQVLMCIYMYMLAQIAPFTCVSLKVKSSQIEIEVFRDYCLHCLHQVVEGHYLKMHFILLKLVIFITV